MFPATTNDRLVLQHMQGCEARAVVVVLEDRQSWFPLLAAATVRSAPLAEKAGAGHQPLATPDIHHLAGGAVFIVQSVC